jgi:hypothetical protein
MESRASNYCFLFQDEASKFRRCRLAEEYAYDLGYMHRRSAWSMLMNCEIRTEAAADRQRNYNLAI